MSKFIKRICVFFVTATLLTASSFASYESNLLSNHYNLSEQTLNEYQILKSLNNKLSTNSLDSSSLNSEQFNAIQNYTEFYTEKVINLQQYSDEELRNLNYNENQISAIRAFDPTNPDEALLLKAATVVTVDGDFTSYTHSNSGTTAKFVVEFNCEGIQSNWFNDIFAVTWSTPLNATSLSGYVDYKTASGFRTEIKHTPKADSLYGSSIIFPKYIRDNTHNESAYVIAGSIIGTLHSNTNVLDITGFCSYGYNTISTNPSVSFTAHSMSPGISFSWGVTEMATHRFYR